ncbi:SIR2 family protein [Acidocella sp.]|uniref:SIR2 family NAD-dependent protein deacylase n=1 Tax=Acidocella sp. TaxID=50710 RepID=UPI0017B0155E|nr:SIR2 family protein [Acidocella sp.]NNM57798.1 SIR2 family protein [Acidocella sp.]
MSAALDTFAKARTALRTIAELLKTGSAVPYLGPAVAQGAPGRRTPEALAAFLGTKVALPRRAKGNVWAAAQHIESYKHRNTVTALMNEAFAAPVPPAPLHSALAQLNLPLIVESWYDDAMRSALAGLDNWGEVQGITRAGIGEDRWFRFYNAAGEATCATQAAEWTTLLYRPHGGVTPARNYLISDADYVEVLTEIDIQTPIPEEVRHRRAGRSFLFLGCRFHDQMLRSYARQIMKRSTATHYALLPEGEITRNESRFLTEQGIIPVTLPFNDAISELLSCL